MIVYWNLKGVESRKEKEGLSLPMQINCDGKLPKNYKSTNSATYEDQQQSVEGIWNISKSV